MTEKQVQAYARRCYKVLKGHRVMSFDVAGAGLIRCSCDNDRWWHATDYPLHLSRVLAKEMK